MLLYSKCMIFILFFSNKVCKIRIHQFFFGIKFKIISFFSLVPNILNIWDECKCLTYTEILVIICTYIVVFIVIYGTVAIQKSLIFVFTSRILYLIMDNNVCVLLLETASKNIFRTALTASKTDCYIFRKKLF